MSSRTTNIHEKSTGSELVPVKFSRLTRRGILLGLSAAQLVTVATALITIVIALYLGGGMWLAGGSTAPPSASSSTGVASSRHAPPEPSPCPATRRGCVSMRTRPRGRA